MQKRCQAPCSPTKSNGGWSWSSKRSQSQGKKLDQVPIEHFVRKFIINFIPFSMVEVEWRDIQEFEFLNSKVFIFSRLYNSFLDGNKLQLIPNITCRASKGKQISEKCQTIQWRIKGILNMNIFVKTLLPAQTKNFFEKHIVFPVEKDTLF